MIKDKINVKVLGFSTGFKGVRFHCIPSNENIPDVKVAYQIDIEWKYLEDICSMVRNSNTVYGESDN